MTQPLSIVLPWPPGDVSPNARGHWSKLHRARKAYREACAWQARLQGAHPGRMPDGRLRVSMLFVPPDRRSRDLDNLIGSMKAGLDGLADALAVNDARFALASELLQDGTIGGFVRVQVVPMEAAK